MLSNPTTTTLHNRQRQHRRQHSTPTAIEPVKGSNLPIAQRKYGHRRGMSLDQRRRKTSPQDRMVSNVNIGYSTTSQHVLQETQQQRLVSPGQHFTQFSNEECYLSSPVVTPHRHSLDISTLNHYGENLLQSPSFPYIGPMNWTIGVDQSNVYANNDLSLYAADHPLSSQSSILNFNQNFGNCIGSSGQENFDGRHSTSSGISEGIMDRVNQFENLALQSPHRPLTPSSYNTNGCFPPTPINTPHVSMIKQEPINVRFMDGYDTSMEETIKPSSKQRACGSIFDDMRKEIEVNSDPSLPNSNIVSENVSFDSTSSLQPIESFMNLSNLHVELPRQENQFDPESLFSPNPTDISPIQPCYQSSSEDDLIALFSDPFTQGSGLVDTTSVHCPVPTAQAPSTLSPQRKPSHRRFDSTSTINLEESIMETGITIDEIASFISGPDPVDGGKWLCMYPNCCKRFGRKENIKSHVQTHLGDRQFQCPYCKKCFVRQHDLKRHAKIHSGIKPYPCQCGNSFARHDALTRHRQRGMCIGAFEGVVKKAAKRGRPRKHRPDDEERLKKSSRTQRKNQEISGSSSISGCSESGDNSPRSQSREREEIRSSLELDYGPLTIDDSSFQFMLPHLSDAMEHQNL